MVYFYSLDTEIKLVTLFIYLYICDYSGDVCIRIGYRNELYILTDLYYERFKKNHWELEKTDNATV